MSTRCQWSATQRMLPSFNLTPAQCHNNVISQIVYTAGSAEDQTGSKSIQNSLMLLTCCWCLLCSKMDVVQSLLQGSGFDFWIRITFVKCMFFFCYCLWAVDTINWAGCIWEHAMCSFVLVSFTPTDLNMTKVVDEMYRLPLVVFPSFHYARIIFCI